MDEEAEVKKMLAESEAAEKRRQLEDKGASGLVAEACAKLATTFRSSSSSGHSHDVLDGATPTIFGGIFNPPRDGDCLMRCAVEHDFETKVHEEVLKDDDSVAPSSGDGGDGGSEAWMHVRTKKKQVTPVAATNAAAATTAVAPGPLQQQVSSSPNLTVKHLVVMGVAAESGPSAVQLEALLKNAGLDTEDDLLEHGDDDFLASAGLKRGPRIKLNKWRATALAAAKPAVSASAPVVLAPNNGRGEVETWAKKAGGGLFRADVGSAGEEKTAEEEEEEEEEEEARRGPESTPGSKSLSADELRLVVVRRARVNALQKLALAVKNAEQALAEAKDEGVRDALAAEVGEPPPKTAQATTRTFFFSSFSFELHIIIVCVHVFCFFLMG
jgi:hypothetical protein